jgi:hypothetical protein
LLNEMANRDRTIKNEGSDRKPKWVIRWFLLEKY